MIRERREERRGEASEEEKGKEAKMDGAARF